MSSVLRLFTVIGLWFAAAYWLRRRRHDGDAYMAATVLAVALAATLEQPAVSTWTDALTAHPNISHVLKHSLGLFAAAGAGETLRIHALGPAARPGRPLRALLLSTAVAALNVTFLLALTPHERHVENLAMATATDSWLLVYWLIYTSFLGVTLISVGRTTARFVRHTEPSPVRTTFALITIGSLLSLVYLVHKLVYVLSQRSDTTLTRSLDANYDAVSTSTISLALLFLVAGITWQALIRLPGVRHLHAYRSLRQLHPLWRRLYEATPAIALTPPGGGRDQLPGLRDVEHALQRRVVEIRDGSLALRPYAPAAILPQAHSATIAAGVPAGLRPHVAEATWLEVGRRRKLAGAQPLADPAPSPTGATNLAGEVLQLRRLSAHLTTIDTIATTLQPAHATPVASQEH